MNFVQRYVELEKQKKVIRRDMKQKRKAITREMRTDDVRSFGSNCACVQMIDVLGIGLGCDFTQMEIARCDDFCEDAYCTNRYCYMVRKNHRYINSVQLYESIKKVQWDLIKDALKIKNK